MSLSEQQKIRFAKSAFRKFVNTIMKLLTEQRTLFEKIMKQIAERKIAEHREKIKDIFNSKNNNQLK